MKRYIIKETDGALQMFDDAGSEVNVTEVLKVSVDRRVYAFYGQMGAGKTTFIKALCKQMGVEDVVNSPTFAIVNVYESGSGEEIYHFDCYRLKNLQEALDLGAEEYLYSGNYCFIEWPEMIENLLPDTTVNIRITPADTGTDRILTIE